MTSGEFVSAGKRATPPRLKSPITTRMDTPEKLAPVHPGDVLWHDFMEPLGLSAYRVAKDIGVTPIVISQIIRHKRAVTTKTALLLGKYLGTSPELWLGLQTDYNLETTAPQYSSLLAAVKVRRRPPISATEIVETLRPKAAR